MPERLDQLAEEAAKESWTYVEFLDRVLDVEVSARVERDVTMKTRLARFPFTLFHRPGKHFGFLRF